MKPISIDSRNNIDSLLQKGLSIRQVSEKCGVSKSTIQEIRAEYLPELNPSPGGRLAKLSAQDQRFCVRSITSGRLNSSVEVAKKLETELDLKISKHSVRRALHRSGLKASEKVEKPNLSTKNAKARLDFANAHKD